MDKKLFRVGGWIDNPNTSVLVLAGSHMGAMTRCLALFSKNENIQDITTNVGGTGSVVFAMTSGLKFIVSEV